MSSCSKRMHVNQLDLLLSYVCMYVCSLFSPIKFPLKSKTIFSLTKLQIVFVKNVDETNRLPLLSRFELFAPLQFTNAGNFVISTIKGLHTYH